MVAQLQLARLSRCKRGTFKIDADRRSIWKNFALAFRPAYGSIVQGWAIEPSAVKGRAPREELPRLGSLPLRTRGECNGLALV
jgi:hypothetical protein